MPTIAELTNKYGATYAPTAQPSNQYQSIANKYGANYNPPMEQSFGNSAKNYVSESLNQAKSFISDPFGAIPKAIGTGLKAIGDTFGTAYESTKTAFKSLMSNASVAQKTADTLHALGSDAAILFSPITGAFAAAETLPVLKQAADVLNLPFMATGKVGEFAANKFIDVLPIDQESKDIVRPAFSEVGALAGQILLGGKLVSMIAKGVKPDKIALDKAIAETKTQVETAKQEIIAKKPEIIAEKYGATYTPPEVKVEPIKSVISKELEPKTEAIKAKTQTEIPSIVKEGVSGKAEISKPQEIIDTAPSGIAKSIEAKAIEAGLTPKLDKLAGYDPSTIKEQARIFTDTINSRGIDEARAMLRGEKPLVEGQKPFPFIVSMEEYLKKNPSPELVYELANSPHVSAASEAASQLGLGQNRVQDSFTAKTQEIKRAREERTKSTPEKKAITTKRAKEAVDKVNLSANELGKIEKFIDDIIC